MVAPLEIPLSVLAQYGAGPYSAEGVAYGETVAVDDGGGGGLLPDGLPVVGAISVALPLALVAVVGYYYSQKRRVAASQ